VLSTGEKSVPLAAEGHIGGHPFVAGALMFGRGREQVGLLVEPRPEHSIPPGDESALSRPYVEEANRDLPTFSRLFKEMIIVSDPARPFPRTPKRTIVRGQALLAYEKEIDALCVHAMSSSFETKACILSRYALVGSSREGHGVEPPSSWDAAEIQSWLETHADSINNGVAVAVDGDLFEQGFDRFRLYLHFQSWKLL